MWSHRVRRSQHVTGLWEQLALLLSITLSIAAKCHFSTNKGFIKCTWSAISNEHIVRANFDVAVRTNDCTGIWLYCPLMNFPKLCDLLQSDNMISSGKYTVHFVKSLRIASLGLGGRRSVTSLPSAMSWDKLGFLSATGSPKCSPLIKCSPRATALPRSCSR